MNVDYKDLNPQDVAKAFKLDKSTVQAWCRKGYINYVDVSEPDSNRPRYLIPQWEFDRLNKLIRKFGKRNWLLYNEKDRLRAAQEHETLVKEVKPMQDDSHIFLDNPNENEVTQVPIKELNLPDGHMEPVDEGEPVKTKTKFDIDNVTKTILYIQSIKERLEDLEAEKNQLLNELELCRGEVMPFL